MTQKEKILQHLNTFGHITDLQAYRLYAVRRLGARIWDLRSEGYKITSKPTKAPNRFGKKTHFVTYVLERA